MLTGKTSTDLYGGDIFILREKMVNDIMLRKRIDKISTRRNPFLNETQVNKIYEPGNSRRKGYETNRKNNHSLAPVIPTLMLPEILIPANVIEKRKTLHQRNKSLKEHMMESRRVTNNLINEKIQNENYKFARRLFRIKSPLSKNSMNDSFNKSREYKEIAKKIKDFNHVNQKVIKSFHIHNLMSKSTMDL